MHHTPLIASTGVAPASQAGSEHLMRHGATRMIMGEHEIAKAMLADIESQPGMASA